MTDLRNLHARAIRASVIVVNQVGADDLDRPTPCADWTLARLLAHMTVQHDGFAAAAVGNGGDPALWEVGPLGPDPTGASPARLLPPPGRALTMRLRSTVSLPTSDGHRPGRSAAGGPPNAFVINP